MTGRQRKWPRAEPGLGWRKGAGLWAYTLIEMLTVIAIIALLASLILVAVPAVNEKRARATAQSLCNALMAAIQSYQADLNAYPPDNPGNPARPPLLYELTGTTAIVQSQGGGRETVVRYDTRVQPPAQGQGYTPTELGNLFNRKGFLNAGEDGSWGRNYLPSLKPNQYAADPNDPLPPDRRPMFLVVPVKGPSGEFNPWHYVSSRPTNNPSSFDLWVTIKPGKHPIRIGN